jgi:hypothetical protein
MRLKAIRHVFFIKTPVAPQEKSPQGDEEVTLSSTGISRE